MASNDWGDSAPRVAYPDNWEELAGLVEASLRDLLLTDPEEYGAGRFAIEVEGLEFAILATEREFPAVRFHHQALEVPDDLREDVIHFANALHGRSSTIGSHWWLGQECLWQVCEFWADKFDQEFFNYQLQSFINVAKSRTPEIRGRFGEGGIAGDVVP